MLYVRQLQVITSCFHIIFHASYTLYKWITNINQNQWTWEPLLLCIVIMINASQESIYTPHTSAGLCYLKWRVGKTRSTQISNLVWAASHIRHSTCEVNISSWPPCPDLLINCCLCNVSRSCSIYAYNWTDNDMALLANANWAVSMVIWNPTRIQSLVPFYHPGLLHLILSQSVDNVLSNAAK